MTPRWDDALIARLKELVAAGLSATQITRELPGGFTRNAILGKKQRLGLSTPLALYIAQKRMESKQRRGPKLTRNGHAVKASTKAAQKRSTREPKSRKKPDPFAEMFGEIVMPTTAADDLAIPVEQRKSLQGLTPWTCRWPIGNPGEPGFGFCGAIPVEGLPYCPNHCRRAYQPPKGKESTRVAA